MSKPIRAAGNAVEGVAVVALLFGGATLLFAVPTPVPSAVADATRGNPDPAPGSLESLQADDAEIQGLMALYEVRDYFTLRERLDAVADRQTPRIRFLRAAVLHAFNRPSDSNAAIDELLDPEDEIPLPLELSAELLELKMNNHLRLHEYAAAHEAARELLDGPYAVEGSPVDPDLLEGVANMAKAYGALADVPPQEIVRRGATVLEVRRGRIPVRFGDSERRFVFDTGANLSTIIRSEAESLGLEVRSAGIEVGTSTDVKVTADVAVADRMTVGGMEFRHVVFLVLDDELLTFDTPQGEVVIRGIVGFPVIEPMGEVRFRQRGDILEVPARVPQRSPRNLAMDELTILVRATYRDDPILCRLDTGANDTVFYEPFTRRYRSEIEEVGERTVDRTAGAGGMREIPAYRVSRIDLSIGDREATLRDVEAYIDPITEAENNYLFCNLGLNALQRFDEYLINFRSMTLQLGDRRP